MTSSSADVETPLAGVRILEAGDTIAVAYAGRLLADLGAEVVTVEETAGSPLRALGPFAGGVPDAERSASFAYFHAGKRSVRHSPADVVALAARSDVVLRATRDGHEMIPDAEIERLQRADPGLVVVDVSTFGRVGTGPGPHASDDLVALAAGGLLSVNSTTLTGPDPQPQRYRGELSSVHAACGTVIAVLGALFERRRSGHGQHIDVSQQAAVASVLATAVSRFAYTGTLPVRQGNRSVGPWGFYELRDGRILMQITRDEEFRRLVRLLGDPDWGSIELFGTTAGRDENHDVLDVFVRESLADFTLQGFLDLAYQHRIAACPIHGARDILEWDHLAARQSLPPVPFGTAPAESVPVPGRPWRFGGGGAPAPGPAPGPRPPPGPAGGAGPPGPPAPHPPPPPGARPPPRDRGERPAGG